MEVIKQGRILIGSPIQLSQVPTWEFANFHLISSPDIIFARTTRTKNNSKVRTTAFAWVNQLISAEFHRRANEAVQDGMPGREREFHPNNIGNKSNSRRSL